MIPLRYHNGNQYLHRKSPDYRNRVKRKMRAYMPSHAFIQAGVVAQGLLQYLAIAAPKLERQRLSDDADASLASGPPFLAVAEPALLPFALLALGGAIGERRNA